MARRPVPASEALPRADAAEESMLGVFLDGESAAMAAVERALQSATFLEQPSPDAYARPQPAASASTATSAAAAGGGFRAAGHAGSRSPTRATSVAGTFLSASEQSHHASYMHDMKSAYESNKAVERAVLALQERRARSASFVSETSDRHAQRHRRRAAETLHSQLEALFPDGSIPCEKAAEVTATLDKGIRAQVGGLLLRAATERPGQALPKEEFISLLVAEMAANKQLSLGLTAAPIARKTLDEYVAAKVVAFRPASAPGAKRSSRLVTKTGKSFSPERLYREHEQAQLRLETRRLAKEALEMAECTFTPKKFTALPENESYGSPRQGSPPRRAASPGASPSKLFLLAQAVPGIQAEAVIAAREPVADESGKLVSPTRMKLRTGRESAPAATAARPPKKPSSSSKPSTPRRSPSSSPKERRPEEARSSFSTAIPDAPPRGSTSGAVDNDDGIIDEDTYLRPKTSATSAPPAKVNPALAAALSRRHAAAQQNQEQDKILSQDVAEVERKLLEEVEREEASEEDGFVDY